MRKLALLAIANLLTTYASFLAVAGSKPSLQRKQRTQSNNHGNISELLDNLLRGYDNSVRPDFGGPPATVEVDIMVRSMGPISEVDMTYSMDCYFRQSWVDRRLAFKGGKETLALSISMLARIWKPDTYFYNGKQSYLHTITSPNRFVRLYQDGRVLYSSRLTIKAGCPMNLEDFPMDIQRCPLKFGSFGYTSEDVIYKWNKARQVAIAEDMKLSQFDLVANPTANHSAAPSMTHREYSILMVSFHLQRHMGNFLIQVYGPCILLVVLSWVSFWLNREATADRVSLGITTVLTMTFLGLEARTDLPKVPYPTALDFFVFLSFAFIFATIIQFAVVHYFTKYGSGECYFSSDFSDMDSDSDSDKDDWTRSSQRHEERRKSSIASNARIRGSRGCPASRERIVEVIPLSEIPFPEVRRRSSGQWQLTCLPCSPPPPVPEPPRRISTRKRRKRTPRYNSVSKIDRASRVVFPLLFLAINVFYWWAYLARSERISYYNTNSPAA
ncbi:gamma-aminobutyric acid receptor alpha-like [Neodiprion virginianus]|uniref:Gamma-aminobutyric acid receptor alpha-like n=1 Tax=Neodiprion lecontei TaxID=441921 RepID=A0A6J0BDP0_NEOLC|nr:gamma-aminobutyric acid receptor alpha-like [Neodiprion lecontei]XP_046429541.1 gamma-aminobutyric acid receptor alpha-like [Neodiprion fabricii]XP_046429542.1 gamma-aminobutyric acid receptor alpha-like [Neodiprion fabricii]XP_046598397.1 gamma-aminobutyric acid receptor alpha-like [Neodiprion lecontei]XP_046626823.1 gamma-aminobutyric acid receptor alpha-like [Neodiprion virginianus]